MNRKSKNPPNYDTQVHVYEIFNLLTDYSFDLFSILNSILGTSLHITDGQKACLFLFNGEGKAEEVLSKSARDEKSAFTPNLGIIEKVSKELKEYHIREGIEAVFCHPLILRKETFETNPLSKKDLIGILYVQGIGNIHENLSFEDEVILKTLSYQTTIALLIHVLRHGGAKSSIFPENLRMHFDSKREKALNVEVRRSHLQNSYQEIIGESVPIIKIFEILDKIAQSEVPVLIEGESGTGKELVARAIHKNSSRKNKPFVAENCAAVTETLLESELFGYVKGAFTGADRSKIGLFEAADGGTLFLDEVGDMSLSMQKKLLRALQEREIRPVGGKKIKKIDVRIIAATNKNLKKSMDKGEFREDLFYRLNVINIELPPLRERGEDILILADFFMEKVSKEMNMPRKVMDKEVREALLKYEWPGNIREMENEIKRMVALGGDVITLSTLSPGIQESIRLSS